MSYIKTTLNARTLPIADELYRPLGTILTAQLVKTWRPWFNRRYEEVASTIAHLHARQSFYLDAVPAKADWPFGVSKPTPEALFQAMFSCNEHILALRAELLELPRKLLFKIYHEVTTPHHASPLAHWCVTGGASDCERLGFCICQAITPPHLSSCLGNSDPTIATDLTDEEEWLRKIEAYAPHVVDPLARVFSDTD